jgi:MoaA/NifB/PqqE/SkfB family radical SAM enzyme
VRTLALEVTTSCNLSCLHCGREKDIPRREMSLPFFRRLLGEAAELGIDSVSLTGGEPLLWSHFAEAVDLCAKAGLGLGMVSNGWLFEERLRPLLRGRDGCAIPLDLCFSLDGADAPTHDEFRQRPGSFARVKQALEVCQRMGLRTSIKCCLWKGNLAQLFDTAALGRALGANVSFVFLTPTPSLVSRNLMPDPIAYDQAFRTLVEKVIPLFGEVQVEGVGSVGVPVPLCNPFWSLPNIDPEGNLTFCCNLSNSGLPNGVERGPDFLGTLTEISLAEGIRRHLRRLEWFVAGQIPPSRSRWHLSCSACLRRFGKLAWLEATDSPWKPVLE